MELNYINEIVAKRLELCVLGHIEMDIEQKKVKIYSKAKNLQAHSHCKHPVNAISQQFANNSAGLNCQHKLGQKVKYPLHNISLGPSDLFLYLGIERLKNGNRDL